MTKKDLSVPVDTDKSTDLSVDGSNKTKTMYNNMAGTKCRKSQGYKPETKEVLEEYFIFLTPSYCH